MSDDDLMLVREVVDLTRLSERTIRAWIAEGRLPAIRLLGPGGPVRIRYLCVVRYEGRDRWAVDDLLLETGR